MATTKMNLWNGTHTIGNKAMEVVFTQGEGIETEANVVITNYIGGGKIYFVT